MKFKIIDKIGLFFFFILHFIMYFNSRPCFASELSNSNLNNKINIIDNDMNNTKINERYNIETFKLDNGMRVVLNEDKSSNLIAHYVVYNVGGLQDFHGKAGIAHFLEHMMFKSTKNFEKDKLKKFFNDNGVFFNAGTGYEITVYYEIFIKELLEKIMIFESDRMQNLVLKEEEINIERDVIKEERRMRVDNVLLSSFIEKLQSIHYNNSYYGASLIGLMSDLNNIKLYDLENFYKQYYDPSNATLVLSGNISKEEAEILSSKYYGKLENRIDPSFLSKHSLQTNPLELVKNKTQDKFYLDIKTDKAKSPTYIQIFSAPTLRSNQEIDQKSALALDILIFLLKEGKKMLFSEFVENEKIASNIFIVYDSFGEDFYPLKLIVNSTSNDNFKIIEEKLYDFFKNKLNDLLTDELVEKTARMIGIDYIYSMDNIENRAQFISYAALVKNIQDPGKFLNDYPNLLFSVTKQDITNIVEKVFLNGPSTIGRILEDNSPSV
jgi:zinc protease